VARWGRGEAIGRLYDIPSHANGKIPIPRESGESLFSRAMMCICMSVGSVGCVTVKFNDHRPRFLDRLPRAATFFARMARLRNRDQGSVLGNLGAMTDARRGRFFFLFSKARYGTVPLFALLCKTLEALFSEASIHAQTMGRSSSARTPAIHTEYVLPFGL